MEGAAGPHSLEVVAGPARGSRIDISSAPLTIGRGEQGDGRLHGDPELSRRHAQVRVLPGHGLLIEDLGSSNGTFVNGRRIPAPTVLRAGDEIELGGTKLRVAGDEAPSAPAAAPPRGQAQAPPAQAQAPPAQAQAPPAQAQAPPAQAPAPAARPQPPPPPARRPALRVVAGWAPGTIIPIGDGPIVLGKRAEGAAALGSDRAIADEHARLSPLADGRVLLEDLGSEAGTLVNGHPIPAPTVVGPGERFVLGGSTLEVVFAAADAGMRLAGEAPALGGVQRLPAGALGWGIGVNLLVRTLAIEVFDVDGDIPALRLVSVLGTAILPISANAYGFYKIFRRPDHRSIKRYLAPTFGMPIIFLVVNLLRLDDYGVKEIVTTILVTIVPITICAVLMMRLRARVARERVESVRRGGAGR